MQNIRAISFDCYGTLVDWERGIRAAFDELFAVHIEQINHEQLLERFGAHESRLEATVPIIPYFEVLRQVATAVADDLNISISTAQADAFAESIGDWPLFDDVLPALRTLSENHTLAILSNVDRRCFDATQAKFEGLIDIVCIAEESGAYKPAPEAFHALTNHLQQQGLQKSQLLHVAQSLYHDHEPAIKLGIQSCWIDRRHDQQGWGAVPSPSGDVQPAYRSNNLQGLVQLLAQEE